MCTAKGYVRPGVPPVSLRCPLVSAAFAWQAWDNVHRQGVGCTPWRPSGVPPVSLGLRRFCVAGVGQCASARGRMYALASLRCPSGVPWSPPLLRGRRFADTVTTYFYKTSDDRIVPPPWRGAGRFVAWLSTSGSNYSKTGSFVSLQLQLRELWWYDTVFF